MSKPAGMQAYATVARARATQVAGGEEASAEIARAMEWLRARGARVPERIADVLLPGAGYPRPSAIDRRNERGCRTWSTRCAAASTSEGTASPR